ncbi:tyrosine-type recombinase/integrase [Rhizobium leguminosarum]|uniref:tyrosine-type recombinase/integrase n=1 Tax=Rhizobium leguminosarum TaxID=384 RepID=UPI003F9ADCCF
MSHRRLPRYVRRYKDRNGKWRTYLRRPGRPQLALPEPLLSESFWKAYHSALENNATIILEVGASKTIPGTFDALISQYYKSSAFTTLEKSTQATYRNQIEQFRKDYGTKPVSSFKAKHVDAILGAVAARSTAQAHKLRKRLGTLMRLAVKWEFATDNPMLHAERIRHKTKGYEPWTEGDIAKFYTRWREGTPQRIAVEILLFTGLRRSDAVRLGRQHIQNDRIVTKIKKSGDMVEVSIPIHETFRRVLGTITHNHLNFIVTAYGEARSEKAFTNWIIDAAREAGLPPHRSPHGLRKAACIRLAQAGCSASQIMAVTGHKNLAEVETYVRDANKLTLADDAMAKLHGVA